MRAELALTMAMTLTWANLEAERPLVLQQAEPAKNEKAATPAGRQSQEGPMVKAIAACGFCLEDGTKVSLILGRELSSGKESTGNRVDFEVSEDIKVNDVLVIPKGSLAIGTITEAQGRRHMGRAGKLNVRIEEVRLSDGSRAKLRAMQENKGQGRQGLMTAAMIGTGILFFPAAPVFLFMRGKDVVIAKGTPVVSYVDGNTELNAANFGAAVKGSETAVTATPEASKPAVEPSVLPATSSVPVPSSSQEQPPPTTPAPPLQR